MTGRIEGPSLVTPEFYKRLSFLHRMNAESYFQGDNLIFNDQVNVLENLLEE